MVQECVSIVNRFTNPTFHRYLWSHAAPRLTSPGLIWQVLFHYTFTSTCSYCTVYINMTCLWVPVLLHHRSSPIQPQHYAAVQLLPATGIHVPSSGSRSSAASPGTGDEPSDQQTINLILRIHRIAVTHLLTSGLPQSHILCDLWSLYCSSCRCDLYTCHF